MYLAKETDDDHHHLDEHVALAPVAEESLAHTIRVFDGDCACCARNHEGLESCDKELLRDLFLALYAKLLWSQRLPKRLSFRAEAVESILQRIQSQKEEIFPNWYEVTFARIRSESSLGRNHSVLKSVSRSSSEALKRVSSSGRNVKLALNSRTGSGSVKSEKRPLFRGLLEALEEMFLEEESEITALLSNPASNDAASHYDLDLYPERSPAAGPGAHSITHASTATGRNKAEVLAAAVQRGELGNQDLAALLKVGEPEMSRLGEIWAQVQHARQVAMPADIGANICTL